jgi:hypothetical protein
VVDHPFTRHSLSLLILCRGGSVVVWTAPMSFPDTHSPHARYNLGETVSLISSAIYKPNFRNAPPTPTAMLPCHPIKSYPAISHTMPTLAYIQVPSKSVRGAIKTMRMEYIRHQHGSVPMPVQEDQTSKGKQCYLRRTVTYKEIVCLKRK